MGKVNFLGVELQSPFIVGSGPLSYDANGLIRLHEAGAGAVVIKTIRGETCINPVPHMLKATANNSLINCEKWSDLEFEQWCKVEIPKAVQAGVKVIASVGHSIEESRHLVAPAEKAGASFIELVSYTNDLVDMIVDAKKQVKIPVLAKVSCNHANWLEVAMECEKAGADALTLCESIGPVLEIDIATGKPVMGGEGGYGWLSGGAIKAVILQKIAEVRKHVKIPIVGLGGLATAKDGMEMLMAGANMMGLCSILILKTPEYLKKLRADFDGLMDQYGYADIDTISGMTQPYLFAPETLGTLPFSFDASKCTKCKLCERACCYRARKMDETDMTMHLNQNECRYCGLCASMCPTGALSYKPQA